MTASPPTGRPRPGPVDLSADVARVARMQQRSGAHIWSLDHLRLCWTVLLVGGVLVTVAAALVTGWPGVWGALLGTAIVGAFFTVSAVAVARVGRENPSAVMMAALFTYVVKIVALGLVMVLIPRDAVVDSRWMAGAIGVGLFGWLGAQLRTVWTRQILYVDPVGGGTAPPVADGGAVPRTVVPGALTVRDAADDPGRDTP
ncbi:hypothetical protein JL107_00655 [Nakamurella flavida]|uniref:ATP synthase subunit I n=1 Tax=Nakamurella flavida TaxID=363630 RepID=A0A938YK67_9ACTN|nr:hypothetical protein [Nakamurella flavida]MBM9474942.1 hypothetical protein [Nakamurella flavida]MDP9776511.1 ATP synthase protein I [Nakamurella flavida]